MPVTAPAHQALVLPLKLRWPDRTDGTALCIGAASPDLGYALFGVDSHSPVGVLLFAVPVTLLLTRALRAGAAMGIAAQLPDGGPLRLHSYGVLPQRRPAGQVTFWCALAGAASHVVLDAFTHSGRWGADLLSLDSVLFTLPFPGEMTGARVLQYLGHVLGSLATLAMAVHIGRSRRLEQWYGADAVARARATTVGLGQRALFWTIAAGSAAAALGLATAVGRSPVFSTLLGATLGVAAAGTLVRPSSSNSSDSSSSEQRPRQDSNLRPSD